MIRDIARETLHLLPDVAWDVLIALLPVVAVFIVFQLTMLRLPKSRLISMGAGMAYTFVGLVLFFLGVEIGFSETGLFLGESIAALPYNKILIPIGLLIGFSVVLAEPAVQSLVHQVETVSGGMIHKSAIYVSLCISVALSVALAMIRSIWGVSLWFFIVPCYLAALILTVWTPRMFTAIAFDAGGVATGPMTSTFVLSFSVGVTSVLGTGGNIGESFGIVAMVAMTPLVTIQILGLIYQRKARLAENLLQETDTAEDLVSIYDAEVGMDEAEPAESIKEAEE